MTMVDYLVCLYLRSVSEARDSENANFARNPLVYENNFVIDSGISYASI